MSDRGGAMVRFERAGLKDKTGRGVRVAIVDSGVHAAHPHVNGVTGGIGIDPSGALHDDFVDRLGHGTAVTAVIREKAPEADLLAVKVFDRELRTTVDALVAAIDWAIGRRARVINLSLGTSNPEHEPPLAAAVDRARRSGAIVVAAGNQEHVRWLPGSLEGAGIVCVQLDWTLPRDTCDVSMAPDGSLRVRASGYPRPIPGVPADRNLRGVSFAVANATGLLARALEAARSPAEALADLDDARLG